MKPSDLRVIITGSTRIPSAHALAHVWPGYCFLLRR